MLQFIQNNAFGVFGILAGLVSSYIFYHRSKRFKAISSAHLSGVLFTGRGADLDKLEIFYDGVAIKNIARTRLGIWNSGNEVIDRSVFVASAPFRVVPETESDDAPAAQVLDCSVHSETNLSTACTASISGDKSHILLDFEYLEPKDGYVIDIIHTQSATFSLAGALKGVKFSAPSPSVHQLGLTAPSRILLRSHLSARVFDGIFSIYMLTLPAALGSLSGIIFIQSGACSQTGLKCAPEHSKAELLLVWTSHIPPFLGWGLSVLLLLTGLIVLASLIILYLKGRIPKSLLKGLTS